MPACYMARGPLRRTCSHIAPNSRPQETWWVSAIGALCSLTYCGIALIMGCIYAGNRLGSVSGNPGSSPADKAFSARMGGGGVCTVHSKAGVHVDQRHVTVCLTAAAIDRLFNRVPPPHADMLSSLGSLAFAFSFSMVRAAQRLQHETCVCCHCATWMYAMMPGFACLPASLNPAPCHPSSLSRCCWKSSTACASRPTPSKP